MNAVVSDKKRRNMENQPNIEKVRLFHPAISIIFSLWAACWAIHNVIWYFANTYMMFSTLGWGSFALAVSPAFWLWLGLVSSSWYAPMSMIFLLWRGGGGTELTRSKSKVAWLVILVPIIVTFLFTAESWWFPIKVDNGHIYIRMFPFL